MVSMTHAARAANPAARSVLSVATRSPFASRALSSNSRLGGQFPRLQLLNTNKRSFSTTLNMVRIEMPPDALRQRPSFTGTDVVEF